MATTLSSVGQHRHLGRVCWITAQCPHPTKVPSEGGSSLQQLGALSLKALGTRGGVGSGRHSQRLNPLATPLTDSTGSPRFSLGRETQDGERWAGLAWAWGWGELAELCSSRGWPWAWPDPSQSPAGS